MSAVLRKLVFRVMNRLYGSNTLYVTGPVVFRDAFLEVYNITQIVPGTLKTPPVVFTEGRNSDNRVGGDLSRPLEESGSPSPSPSPSSLGPVRLLQFKKKLRCAIGWFTPEGKEGLRFAFGGGLGQMHRHFESIVLMFTKYPTYDPEHAWYYRDKVYYSTMWRQRHIYHRWTEGVLGYFQWGLVGGPVPYVFHHTDEDDVNDE
jgi:hypothetical protein